MIMKVIGVELRKGTFTSDNNKSIDYNNIMIHSLKPSIKENGDSFSFGCVPVSVKIKNDRDVCLSIFGAYLTKDDLKSMVDHYYDITFDDKKQVDRIIEASEPFTSPNSLKKGD